MDQIPSPAPRRRATLIAALVLALVAAPAVVLAAHQFSDVPDTNAFHDEISMLADSGVTLGCGSGKFCPKANVNREQMAAFMTRGMGYSTVGTGFLPMSETATTYLAVAELPAGGAAGGTVYVTVSGDVSVLDFGGTCPCGVIIGLQDMDTGASSNEAYFIVGSDAVDGAMANNGSVHWVFEVPSGTTKTYGLYADVFPNPVPLGTDGDPVSEPEVYGNVVAQYSPFGSALPGLKSAAIDLPDAWASQRSTQQRVPPQ